MNTVAIIQARMGSSRLPGKILLDIAGKPMLNRIVQRVLQAKTINHVLVATTDEPQDEPVEDYCLQAGFDCFRGDHLDVLDRYYHAAKSRNANVVVRVSADCPLIDPSVIDIVVGEYLNRHFDVDYVSNIQSPRTFPSGLDVEAFSFSALERAWKESREPFFRENVTTYIHHHPKLFRLCGILNPTDESHHHWTVDTEEDLKRIRQIYRVMGQDDFTWMDVLDSSKSHPQWLKSDGHIAQKVA